MKLHLWYVACLALICAPVLLIAGETRVLKPGESVVVDVAGDRTTFVAEAAQPPVEPPVEPPPSTQPVDPTEAVPYPPVPTFVAQPGTDLAKLTQRAALITGPYVTTGDIKFDCVAQPGEQPILKLAKGQCPQFPPVFAGITWTGGGIADSDDLKTAGPKAGALVHSCTARDNEGFGLIVTRSGKTRVTQCTILRNGSGGIGGTGTEIDVLIDDSTIQENNWRYLRKNSNKWTRGTVTYKRCNFVKNYGRSVWADNYVKYLAVIDSRFQDGQPDKTGESWKAGDVSGEISGQMLVKNCYFKNDKGGRIYVNEMMRGTVIDGCTFDGDFNLVIEMRNMARGEPVVFSLRDVLVKNCVFTRNSMYIGPSSAGESISLSKNNIVIDSSNRWPDGNVASHVKIKP